MAFTFHGSFQAILFMLNFMEQILTQLYPDTLRYICHDLAKASQNEPLFQRVICSNHGQSRSTRWSMHFRLKLGLVVFKVTIHHCVFKMFPFLLVANHFGEFMVESYIWLPTRLNVYQCLSFKIMTPWPHLCQGQNRGYFSTTPS